MKQNNFLLKEHHPNRDFFITDIFDGTPLKDDMASMEHPVFSLSTKPDLRELEYINGNSKIKIIPYQKGLPTIFDKDILLYCGSLLMAEINKGIIPSKTLRISVHDFLVTTNRPTGGINYKRLKESLERLRGTTILTDIRTNGIRQSAGFGFIDKYNVVESSKTKNRMTKLEIGLSEVLSHL